MIFGLSSVVSITGCCSVSSLSRVVCGDARGQGGNLERHCRRECRLRLALGRFGKEGAELLLRRGLGGLGKTIDDLQNNLRSALWKVVLASWINSKCGVSNQWLTEQLYMGSMYKASRMVSEELKAPQNHRELWRQLECAKN